MLKNNRLSKRAADELRSLTGMPNLDKAVEALMNMRDVADREADQLADRLHEMQVRVELAQQDLDRRDRQFLEHVQKLADALGLEYEKVTEQVVLDEIRAVRSKGERLDLFYDVASGNFDPDRELLRRVACAVGTATVGDVKATLERLGALTAMPGKVANLERELAETKAELMDLREDME